MTDIKQKRARLVTHFIAGYPDLDSSYDTAVGLIDGGAYALEMQIPFSDPSADGPVIELACRKALDAGFRVSDGLRLIERIKKYSSVPLFLMSYSGIVFNMGINRFVKKAAAAGVSGLIIPDLTPGTDEGLYDAGRKAGISVVPVVVPGIPGPRLDEILSEKPEWVYLALRSGITGSYTELDDENLGFIDRLKGFNVKVMAGFGIRSPEQVSMLQPHCDAAIVGSFIVDRLTKACKNLDNGTSLRDTAAEAVSYLLGE